MGILLGLLFYCLFCGAVGYFIDEDRGALWGFLLGPIGWIIAAILKGSNSRAAENYRPPPLSDPQEQPTRVATQSPKRIETDEQRKWKILKEVDAEIRAASERVSQVDPALDAALAEKYLILNEKQYLQSLADAVIQAHLAIASRFSQEVLQSGQRQKMGYEQALGADRLDPVAKVRVKNVEIYDGSWLNWKGGICIQLEDGRTVLLNKSSRRVFDAGDDSFI